MFENKKRDWSATKLLVFPELREQPDEYERRYKLGLRRAQTDLSTRAAHELITLDAIKQTHEFVFGRVYPFAGQFRTQGQEVAVGQDKWNAAFHSRIVPELDRLQAFMKEKTAKAGSLEEKAQLVALYHEQFERIHPFRDGNGRTGRAIMEAQITALLGKQPEPIVDRDNYTRALESAHVTGDLAPLCYAITGIALPDNLCKATYRCELWPTAIEKITPLGTPFRVICDGIDEAQDFEDAVLTDRLSERIDRNPKLQVELRTYRHPTANVLMLDICSPDVEPDKGPDFGP